LLALLATASILGAAPELPRLPPIRRDPQITYVDRSGAVIGVRGGKYAPPVNIDRLPAYVPAAFVSIEDRRFYEHQGFDPMGMARALMTDVAKGRAAQGASTITQQLARNLFLTNDQTFERKADELVLAVQLERTYSKKQILGLYLSRVNFGKGAWGLEAAAQRYFNKPAARLTVREAAMLAAIMKSPTNYNPVDEPERSDQRTALVLQAMVENGAISAADAAKATAQKPKVYKTARTDAANYFIDWIDGQVARMGPPRQDLVVETTLDLPSETAAADALKKTVDRYKPQKVEQGALVSMDGLGRVRAMVGGTDYVKAPYNRAVEARRQAGSSWKPFVYLTAMEQGLTPDTPVVDEPVTIANWSPRNFEPEFLGPITLETALAHSVNTVAARLADQVGRQQVAATARRLGIASSINTDPAMALGTTQVSPLEMAQAYEPFGNGGYRVPAYGIERIRTAGGQLIYQKRADTPALVIANPPLSEMNRMMRQVIVSGTGARARIAGYDLAGKTGTTTDFKDAWFCGFTGGLSTVVWLGRDDATPMRAITGGSAPADAWRSYMTVALKRFRVQPILPGGAPPVPLVQPGPAVSPSPEQAPPSPVPAGAPVPASDAELPPTR
jgi:penicillin-binding protein 1A